MAEKPAARRGGRPLKEHDDSQPGAAHLSARVRPSIRRGIVAEAERTGRTVSQTADALLEVALQGYADTRDLACAPGLRRMAAFARTVQNTVGDPASDRTAWAALQAGMEVLAREIMPTPPLAQGDEAAFLVAHAELQRRLPVLAAAIGDEPLAGPLPRPNQYFGPGAQANGFTFRLIRTRLQNIAARRGDEHTAEAAELVTVVDHALSLLPTAQARGAEEVGRELAQALLGTE